MPKIKGKSVSKHKTIVNYFHMHPYKIESRFRSIQKEFSLGHGRIDLIGRDKDGTLCLVEVKTRDSELMQGKRQVAKYQSQLANFLGLIGVETKIRAIVVTPTEVVDVGMKKSTDAYPKIKMPSDIPTSREIFGLKKTLENSNTWQNMPERTQD